MVTLIGEELKPISSKGSTRGEQLTFFFYSSLRFSIWFYTIFFSKNVGEEGCYRELALTCDLALTLLENSGTVAHQEKQEAHIHSELHPKRQMVYCTDSLPSHLSQ